MLNSKNRKKTRFWGNEIYGALQESLRWRSTEKKEAEEEPWPMEAAEEEPRPMEAGEDTTYQRTMAVIWRSQLKELEEHGISRPESPHYQRSQLEERLQGSSCTCASQEHESGAPHSSFRSPSQPSSSFYLPSSRLWPFSSAGEEDASLRLEADCQAVGEEVLTSAGRDRFRDRRMGQKGEEG
ncbi:hypothetical protein SLEP1_g2233 [Rubroshorea leprosula]|uniref:Uncharacterized protein n=1 Tax=Rubroshorea leprosula TaxID=152421 RepID=A0AAV5HQY9_9ROSI|nr:hypothetical protein SLEP1_g2233 [Rubroshorea leprosula]